tara:strand:- start:420 stop:1595 length:1176 start_codon:yes stop_codon:yes gene_type:complete
MASLAGNTIATTYATLIKLDANDASLVAGGSAAIQLKTGDNDSTVIYLNTDRVGIGTSAPLSVLHVKGVASSATNLATSQDSASLAVQSRDQNRYLFFSNDSNYSPLIQSANIDGSTAYNLSLNPYGGYVGIGTSDPGDTFHVAGNIMMNDTNQLKWIDSGGNAYTKIAGNGVDMDFYTGGPSNVRMSILEGGNVGIGVDAPAYKLDIAGNTDGTSLLNLDHSDADNPAGIRIAYSGGSPNTADSDYYISMVDTSTTRCRIDGSGNVENVTGDDIVAISDQRLKENVADYTGGLAIINALKPKTYTWKPNVDRGMSGTRYGFIAQEVMEVEGYEENMNLAKKGKINEDDMDAVKSLCSDGVLYKSQMSAKECILISAIQELSAKVEALENA